MKAKETTLVQVRLPKVVKHEDAHMNCITGEHCVHHYGRNGRAYRADVYPPRAISDHVVGIARCNDGLYWVVER